jgi:hypothetical protein
MSRHAPGHAALTFPHEGRAAVARGGQMPAEPIDLDSLLSRFLRRDPIALDQLPRLIRPRLKSMARKIGRGLPGDILEEIVQEVFGALMSPGSGRKFNPQRGSIWKFLLGELLNATHRVRATYCAPGVRTRGPSKKDGGEDPSTAETFNEEIHRKSGSEVLAPEFRSVQARFDLAILLRGAPQPLIAALVGIHEDGEKVKDVAQRLGVSRFWIARESNALFARRINTVAGRARRIRTR